MRTAALLTLLVPAAVTLLPLSATLRTAQSSAPRLLCLALAIGLGLGLGSCAHVIALALFDGTWAGLGAVDAAIGLVLVGVWWLARRSGRPMTMPRHRWSALDVGLALACLLAAAGFFGLFETVVYRTPHGGIDAIASWTWKAPFLAAGGTRWRLPFGDFSRHRDYPLLLSAGIARAWRYMGGSDQAVPISIAFLFLIATAALLFGALHALRGRTVGLLGALCLLGTPGFAWHAGSLLADGVLSYFMLASLVLLAYWQRAQSGWRVGLVADETARASAQSVAVVPPAKGSAALAWAGLAAGLAAWTKREGLLFFGTLVGVYVAGSLRSRSRLRAAGWFAIGAAVPLALLRWQHQTLATRRFTGGRSLLEVRAAVTDPSRYADIASAYWGLLLGSPSRWLLLALPAFVLLMGGTADTDARAAARRAGAVVALLAVMQAAIFLTTPAPLVWHLSTALDRLLFQLWPSAIFALFLWTASPDERWSDADA